MSNEIREEIHNFIEGETKLNLRKVAYRTVMKLICDGGCKEDVAINAIKGLLIAIDMEEELNYESE